MKKLIGFTLIELLVIIAIIALIGAILIPAVQRAKENQKREQQQLEETDDAKLARTRRLVSEDKFKQAVDSGTSEYSSGVTLIRFKYEGRVYIVNALGGIIEHKPTP